MSAPHSSGLEKLSDFKNEIAWLEAELLRQKLKNEKTEKLITPRKYTPANSKPKDAALAQLGWKKTENGKPVKKKKKQKKKRKPLSSRSAPGLSQASNKVYEDERRRFLKAEKPRWKIRRSKSTVERLMEFKQRGGESATGPIPNTSPVAKIRPSKKSPEEQTLAMELLSMPGYLRGQHLAQAAKKENRGDAFDIYGPEQDSQQSTPRKLSALSTRDISDPGKALLDSTSQARPKTAPLFNDTVRREKRKSRFAPPELPEEYFEAVQKLTEMAEDLGEPLPRSKPTRPLSKRMEALAKPVGAIDEKKQKALRYEDVIKPPGVSKPLTEEQKKYLENISKPKLKTEKFESEYKFVSFGSMGQRFQQESKYKQSPGPADYDLNKSSLHAGGATKISDANPKSYLDWIIYRSKQTPGPSDYGAPDLPRKEGVRFSNVDLPTEIDIIAKRASQTPGPADYDLNKSSLHVGGACKISDANPKSDLDWIIYRAKQTPGPSDYGAPDLPRKQGVRFSNVNLPTEIDIIAKRASQTPGPGAYGIPDLPRKQGVKFSNVFLPTEIDVIAKRASEIPGPGAYQAVDPNKVSKRY
jgi:hypothetical protein